MIKVIGLIAILFALAFLGSEGASRDEIIVRTTLAAVAAGLFPVLFVWNMVTVPPGLMREQETKIEETEVRAASLASEMRSLEARIHELTKPDFDISINFAVLGSIEEGGTHCLLHLVLANRGTPSAAVETTWRLIFATSNPTTVHEAHPNTLTKDEVFDMGDGTGRKYVRDDGIDKRASYPIPRLGYTSGVLRFIMPTLTIQKLMEEKTLLTISVCDVNGTRFSNSIPVSDLHGRSGYKFMPNLAFPLPISLDRIEEGARK
ncbi:hypothetical protein VQ045_10185 [Aurantimonas sp. E1-2-R+4]|uniref:hypothetical protein n=1 Tax=Aurantimonas sp. E1-2-R+4 TaxID=3113714 RepID=UPI002F92E509